MAKSEFFIHHTTFASNQVFSRTCLMMTPCPKYYIFQEEYILDKKEVKSKLKKKHYYIMCYK